MAPLRRLQEPAEEVLLPAQLLAPGPVLAPELQRLLLQKSRRPN
jgi:hypothetical protein